MVKATEELTRLWEEYEESGDSTLRNRLILRYLPLVKYISDRIFARIPKWVDIRDLRSAGIFGLIHAIEGFDVHRGIKFETYCSVRVRGAILDELRAQDWVPRPVRNRTQRFKEAKEELRRELGRQPDVEEIAIRLGVDLDEARAIGREFMATNFVSLSSASDAESGEGGAHTMEILAESPDSDPIERIQRRDVAELIRKNLDDKQREVLALYYYQDLTMREIGRHLNLSESRVCQIHTRIMEQLKANLKEQEAELVAKLAEPGAQAAPERFASCPTSRARALRALGAADAPIPLQVRRRRGERPALPRSARAGADLKQWASTSQD